MLRLAGSTDRRPQAYCVISFQLKFKFRMVSLLNPKFALGSLLASGEHYIVRVRFRSVLSFLKVDVVRILGIGLEGIVPVGSR
jgi:hypothetical protein